MTTQARVVSDKYINEVAEAYLVLTNGSGVMDTGEAGNISTLLAVNGVFAATPARTVAEVSSGSFPGLYKVSYTPVVLGDHVVQAIHSTNNADGYMFHHTVKKRRSDPVFSANIASNNADILFLVGQKIDGLIKTDTASVTINIYTAAGVLVNSSPLTSSSVDSYGMFDLTWTGGVALLSANTVYSVSMTFVDANGTSYAFTEPLRLR